MFKKTAVAAALTIALMGVLAIIQLSRYEYHYEGHLRVDRLTGKHQYHCASVNDWRLSQGDCPSTHELERIAKQSLPKLANAEPELSPKKCLSDAEYMERSKLQGFNCQLSNGRPLCGIDRNGNGILEPWELNGEGFSLLCLPLP